MKFKSKLYPAKILYGHTNYTYVLIESTSVHLISQHTIWNVYVRFIWVEEYASIAASIQVYSQYQRQSVQKKKTENIFILNNNVRCLWDY